MSRVLFLTCPFCGWCRPLHRKFKPPFSFLQLDPTKAVFIDYREAEYKSMRRVGGLTLKEAAQEGYADLVREVAEQALRVHREAKRALEEAGEEVGEASEGED